MPGLPAGPLYGILLLAIGAGCGARSPVTPQPEDTALPACGGITPQVTDLGVEDLATMLEDGSVFELINVHIPHGQDIPGTDAAIPYSDIDALVEYLGPLNTPAVLYCRTGPMSEAAAADLVALGYCHIHDFPPAMEGWEEAGYELVE